MHRAICILLMALTVGALSATWEKMEFLPIPRQWGERGPGPIRSCQLRVNNGRNAPARVKAVLCDFNHDHPVTVIREAMVLPGSGVLLDFPVPGNDLVMKKMGYALTVDGKPAISLPALAEEFIYGSDLHYHFFVASRKIPENLLNVLSASQKNGMKCIYSPLPFEQWGTDDRSFQGNLPISLLDKGNQRNLLLLSATEELPPAQQFALQRWKHCGGTIVRVVLPGEPWPKNVPGEEDMQYFCPDGLGYEVYWRPISSKNLAEWKKQESSLTGSLDHERVKKLEGQGLIPNIDFLTAGQLPSGWLDHLSLSLPDIPVLALVILMLTFVALAFPVSFLWLQKRHREYWLFWTTPLFSILFCLLVLLLVNFHDGWKIKVKSHGITWLDQESKMARTFAMISILSPYSPSQSLVFEREDNLFFSRKAPLTVENAPGQVINPSIISPRNVLNISTSRFGTRNERLRVIRQSDGGLEIVNGLGAPLEKVCWLDEDGRHLWSSATTVPAGGRARLQSQAVAIAFSSQAPLVDRFMEMTAGAVQMLQPVGVGL